jgi:thiosulfate/3-mercaptopyruvate sulfurtransferase
VVAYDDAGGAMAAARLYFLLRWLGHASVSVLDGGVQAWEAAGLALSDGEDTPSPAAFVPRLDPSRIALVHEVEALRADPASRLLDARGPERYSGASEPIDPVAGHIAGARSLPFSENLVAGRFRSPGEIRAAFARVLEGASPERAVAYCGSGVTACHLLLAADYAGVAGLRLYPGSFSEWILDPARPVRTGTEPG